MEGIPQLRKIMAGLPIMLDSLARRVLALLDPLHQVPRPHIRDRDFLYPLGEEVAFRFAHSAPEGAPGPLRPRQRVPVKRILTSLRPPGLRFSNDPGGSGLLSPGSVEHIGQGLRHGVDFSGSVRVPVQL